MRVRIRGVDGLTLEVGPGAADARGGAESAGAYYKEGDA
jgi:hypothetical protein